MCELPGKFFLSWVYSLFSRSLGLIFVSIFGIKLNPQIYIIDIIIWNLHIWKKEISAVGFTLHWRKENG